MSLPHEEWDAERARQAVELEKRVHPEESNVELAKRLFSEASDAVVSGPYIQPDDPRYASYVRLQEFIEQQKEE